MSVGLRKIRGMGCSSREEIVEVSNAFDAALDRLCELTFDVLATPELLCKLEHFERATRRLRAQRSVPPNPSSPA